jgi:hypothetical protein
MADQVVGRCIPGGGLYPAALADVCASAGLWHHIDGAYGAFFYLSDNRRGTLRGLPCADSPTLDPHKGMFLPDDPSQHGPELSRRFPGLRVWLSVKLFGMAAFREAIAEKRAPRWRTRTPRRSRSWTRRPGGAASW